MITKKITVVNETGLHARPSSCIVQLASQFKSEITLTKEELDPNRTIRANAKSIMNILLLAAEAGSVLILEAEGPDEADAVAAIEKLFADKFQENEY